MVDVIRELRHGARRLRRAPVFSFTTIVVLALGIGATTSVFTLVDGILIRPLPFLHPERLVDLSHTVSVSGAHHINQSDATYLLYQRHATAFTSVAAYRESAVTLGAIDGSAQDAERLPATGITASLFKTLGVVPSMGRPFSEDEDRPNGAPVVIISSALWNRTFGADKHIVGKRVLIDGRSSEIVGVMPADFHYPNTGIKLWMPLQLDPAHTRAGSFNYIGLGRLSPGVTASGAAAELDRLSPRTLDEFPDYIPKAMWEQAHLRAVITPLRDVMVGDVSHLLWILMGAVGLVLVIACANVANLFLVRAEGRQRELAVRSALGAAKSVIAAQLLAESAIVATVGGVIGLGLAFLGVKALSALPAGIDLPRLTEVGVDGEALVFALGVTVLGALIVSVVPLIRLRRITISAVLRESDRSATTGAARQRTRSAFVIVQVAMALVLVASSGLMAR
ncbi:MAG TPA: ABC transporter permease, partial [Gemmatimonadaceae bacterium]|nr:ABC transporter permease [Gemmatimonadaceae bacterium]